MYAPLSNNKLLALRRQPPLKNSTFSKVTDAAGLANFVVGEDTAVGLVEVATLALEANNNLLVVALAGTALAVVVGLVGIAGSAVAPLGRHRSPWPLHPGACRGVGGSCR